MILQHAIGLVARKFLCIFSGIPPNSGLQQFAGDCRLLQLICYVAFADQVAIDCGGNCDGALDGGHGGGRVDDFGDVCGCSVELHGGRDGDGGGCGDCGGDRGGGQCGRVDNNDSDHNSVGNDDAAADNDGSDNISDGNDLIAHAQTIIDEKRWGIVMMHDILPTITNPNATTTQAFSDFMDWLDANRALIDVVTIRDVIGKIRP